MEAGEVMSQTTEELEIQASGRGNRMEARHWIIRDLFEEAQKQNLMSPGCEPFSQKILEVTGERIPPGSLKYWYNGHSTPKLTETDLMAKALGYDLDLCLQS